MHAIFKNASPFFWVDRYRHKVEMGPSIEYDPDAYHSIETITASYLNQYTHLG